MNEDRLKVLANKIEANLKPSDEIEELEYEEYNKAAKQTDHRCSHCKWPKPTYRIICRYCRR